MTFPVLEFAGGRVVAFEERHLAPRYVAWLNDPDVVRYSEQRHRRHTLESCHAYFESFRHSSDHFLAIEAVNPALGHIGNMTIAIDVANRVADVSIMIGEPAARGRGYASRAWSAVIRELFEGQSVRKVTAGTMADNEPMLRLMRSSGMRIEGRRERQFLCGGREVDLVMAAIFSPDAT